MNKSILILLEFLGYLWCFCLYLLILPILIVVLSQGLDYFLFEYLLRGQLALTTLFEPYTLLVQLLGVLVAGWGLVLMSEAGRSLYQEAGARPFAPFLHHQMAPVRLYKAGWFGWVRHPILLGYLFLLTSLGIFIQSFSFVFWWVPVIASVALQYALLVEEPRLNNLFGKEYQEYQKKIPALFPQLSFGKQSVAKKDRKKSSRQ